MLEVKKSIQRMLGDVDQDTAVWFLDAKIMDSRIKGEIGDKTKRPSLRL